MKEDNTNLQESTRLRQKAEAQLENKLSKISIPTTQAETSKLIRELQLQLIELELQNEELRLQINPGLSTEHQHNQSILKSEIKYREIFGNMQDVYYETGINGNTAGRNLLGNLSAIFTLSLKNGPRFLKLYMNMEMLRIMNCP